MRVFAVRPPVLHNKTAAFRVRDDVRALLAGTDCSSLAPRSKRRAGRQMPRLDGRADSQLRPLTCERALHTADGSARWTAGARLCPVPAQSALLRCLTPHADNTCVLAAVYGPRAVPPRREQADRAVVEVVATPAAASRGAALRSTSSCVASAVRAVLLAGLHPRTGVTVALQARDASHRCRPGADPRTQSVHEDGATLAAAVNAAVAAVLDARLPLSGLLGARCVAQCPHVRPQLWRCTQRPSPSPSYPLVQCWLTPLRSRSRCVLHGACYTSHAFTGGRRLWCLQEALGVVTFALLERHQASAAPSGEAFADDIVLSSVTGKLSGAAFVYCSSHRAALSRRYHS